MKNKPLFLTDAQLKSEVERCLFCEEKPCKEACPCDCSPADFIMAVKVGEPSDYKKSAKLILAANPLGGTCGAICPDKFCMKKCSRKLFDTPINIPAVQATIIQKAKEMKVMPEFEKPKTNGKKVAIVGAGPSAWGAAAVLSQKGYKIDIYESNKPGGMCNLIPDYRLNKKVLMTDIEFIKSCGEIQLKPFKKITNPTLLKKNYDAVIVASGLDSPIRLGISGEELAVSGYDYLKNLKKYPVKGKKIAIVGGGAIACDCAVTSVKNGAREVEIFALEKLRELPLFKKEFDALIESGVHINGRIRVTGIIKNGKKIAGIKTVRVFLPKGKKFHPSVMKDCTSTEQTLKGFDMVIVAIGAKPSLKPKGDKGIFFTGEVNNGPGSAVEAIASGKNTALEVDAYLKKSKKIVFKDRKKSHVVLEKLNLLPVPVNSEFFGRKILSPFLLSAAPPTDGLQQMRKAYEAGWAGGVMKTAFDNVPIHIPSEYMFVFSNSTYGNADNVSDHPLDRVCKEIEKLVKEFPDRLTMASTGGPVTNNDESDRKVWQSNTKKLENAGAMGIEYSLSCPQGGDGTKGDIVSQDGELSAKIVDWIMQVSNPDIPKLFKLTGAVTSIYVIVDAIKKVLEKYPNKKAGITLANSFPALGFRKREVSIKSPSIQGGRKGFLWDEGVIVGMSGEAIAPISNLTISKVAKLGVTISGNGGPMNYKSAAHFLALGAKSVQFCTIVLKYGYSIINELNWGLSHLLEEKGFKSVQEFIGCALPEAVTPFMELSAIKKIPEVIEEFCMHCGNCTRCGYLAITLNKNKLPVVDSSKCIGCSLCAKKCFAGALYMRKRTKKELHQH